MCEPCQKRGGGSATCTWSNNVAYTNTRIPTDQVKWLDKRIRQLEDSSTYRPTTRFDSSVTLDSTFQSSIPEIAGTHRTSRSCSLHPQDQQPMTSLPYNAISPARSLRKTPHDRPEDPAMPEVNLRRPESSGRTGEVSTSGDHFVHAIIGGVPDEHHTEGFFGSSSAGTFMQSVKRMVEEKLGGTPQSGNHNNVPLLVPGHNSRQMGADYVLPPRKKTDRLMASFWKYVYVLYPYLDKAQMEEDYERIWTRHGSISEERSFMCLLNIMLALSCQVEESIAPEERGRSADVFYRRARELLDVVETGSVRLVQSFLLLGQYFQSTNEPHPCWVFVGIGIRTAQSLGLHLPETSQRVSDKRTREILRKVWHGCVFMDRVLSMTYGRPCMIGPRTARPVPLPLSMDDELLSQGSVQQRTSEAQQPSLTDFYVFSLRLYEILYDILLTFYFTDVQQCQSKDGLYDEYFGSSSSSGGTWSVFELERRISSWENSVPDHLRIGNYRQDCDKGAVVYRQAIILHQRYVGTNGSHTTIYVILTFV